MAKRETNEQERVAANDIREAQEAEARARKGEAQDPAAEAAASAAPDESREKPALVAIVPENRGEGADSPDNRDTITHPDAVQENIIGTDVAVAPDPRLEGTRADLEQRGKSLKQHEPAKDENRRVPLPENAFDSEAFRAANPGARAAFGSVVRRPGHVFPDHGGGGRYVNIFDLNDVYDVRSGDEIPEGLFLFPANYLVRDDEREDRLRG